MQTRETSVSARVARDLLGRGPKTARTPGWKPFPPPPPACGAPATCSCELGLLEVTQTTGRVDPPFTLMVFPTGVLEWVQLSVRDTLQARTCECVCWFGTLSKRAGA